MQVKSDYLITAKIYSIKELKQKGFNKNSFKKSIALFRIH